MPCEACNAQFTVFKRKKSCTECRRLYCSNCLTKIRERSLCQRCVIFNTRPLSKIELLKLKAKDLIFFLQSKHISTTGCVEKEELVNLVLIHVNNYSPDSQSSGRNQCGSNDDRSNPFDQIKNTCQNLFSSFTEKIAADLNFDTKPSQSGQQPPHNIFAQQPRRSSSSRTGFFAGNTANQSQRHPTSSPGQSSSPNKTQSPASSSGRTSSASSNGPTSPVQNNIQLSTDSRSTQSAAGHTRTSTNPTTRQYSSGAHASSTTTTLTNNYNNGVRSTIHSGPKKTNQSDIGGNIFATSNGIHLKSDRVNDLSGNGSGCECSDDEIITNFNQTRCKRYNSSGTSTNANNNAKCDEQEAGPSGSASSSTKTAPNSSSTNKAGLSSSDDSSDVSSFEDLGFTACAGVSSAASASATICGGNAGIDSETWQIINQASFSEPQPTTSPPDDKRSAQTPTAPPYPAEDIASNSKSVASTPVSPTPLRPPTTTETSPVQDSEHRRPPQLPEIRYTSVDDSEQTSSHPHSTAHYQNNQTFQPHSSVESDTFNQSKNAMPKFKPNRKISRRRSDGIVYTSSSASTRHNFLDDDDNLNITEDMETDGDDNCLLEKITNQRRRPKKSCHKCGKTKGDIRKHIDRFRKQLETTTNASETEIKQQLNEFLSFLESRSRNSIDDGIDGADDVQASDGIDSITDGVTYGDVDDAYDEYGFDDDTGIHVYGTNDEQTTTATTHQPRQFINIGDYETIESLEDLTVKQLKEILMLNRIDFKGCCEKGELLERVQRLWNDMHTSPAVEKLPTDDLCKICMDAPIECVLLECGHMATCTSCGKVLSECPICRQYIVRVVRFFKA